MNQAWRRTEIDLRKKGLIRQDEWYRETDWRWHAATKMSLPCVYAVRRNFHFVDPAKREE